LLPNKGLTAGAVEVNLGRTDDVTVGLVASFLDPSTTSCCAFTEFES